MPIPNFSPPLLRRSLGCRHGTRASRCLALLLSPLIAGGASADTTLPETLVTASRIEEPADSALYATSVITREQIEREPARDVAELLERLPGIAIGRNGGPGQATSLFLRGTASDHVLVLIDGIPAQSATTGAAALQHIDPETIERIEVVRGPASTLYGSGAVGGVIQLFTRKGAARAKTPALHAHLQTGGEGTREVDTGLSGRNGAFSASVDLIHRQTEGYPPKTGSKLSRGYRHDTFNLQAAYRFDPDLDLTLGHWQSQGNVEYLDFFNNAVDQDVRNSVTRLALEMVHNDHWSSRLQLGSAIDRTDENQSSDFAHTRRTQLDWQHTWLANDRHTVVGGLTLTREKARALSFGSGYDRTSRITALYLQDRFQQGPFDLQAGVRGINHSAYGRQLTWNLAAGFRLDEATRLHANAGTAFRSPSATDLYYPRDNPNLKPERSRSLEFGVSRRLPGGQQVWANLFHTRIRDLIEYDPITFTIGQVERARIRGIEAGYGWQGAHWNLDLAYTWLDAENLDQNSSLARRPENKLDASADYVQGRWHGKAMLTAASDRRESRFRKTVLAAYTRVDLSLDYALDPSWRVEGRILNLFDEAYELAEGYPAQGRLALIGIRYAPQ